MLTSCSPLLLLPCSMLFVFELWLLSSPSHNCHGSISISRSSTSSYPELYHGSPATTRSTPVINRRRPALLMIHYDDLCFMEQDCTGSSTMIETRSDLLPWLSPSPRNGWHQINSHVLCFPTSPTTCPSTSQWFGTFNLTLISWTFALRFDRRDSGFGFSLFHSGFGFSLFRPWALQTFRPEWCRRQNGGISLKDFTQPYFMRVTFRQRDPNAILPQLEFCTR